MPSNRLEEIAETNGEETNDFELHNESDYIGGDVEQNEALNLEIGDRKLVTQPYDLGLKSLSGDIQSGRIKLAIEYQRNFVWDLAKSSRLIESILLNVPIPVCYFAEDEEGVYEVIDGLQRLTAIKTYFENEFALSGISVMKELDGKKFQDLSPRDQRRLENRTIRCVVITADSHPDIKFDVFERLNTGAVALKAQELRNSVYRGPLNEHLKTIATERYLLDILGNFSNSRMDVEELILRFLSLAECKLENYKPPLRQFLNGYMREHRTEVISETDLARFRSTCELVKNVIGSTPFKAPSAFNSVNRALFDAIMVNFALSDQSVLLTKSSEVKEVITNLLSDEDFLASIGRATANKGRMLFRVGHLAHKLGELGIPIALSNSIINSSFESTANAI